MELYKKYRPKSFDRMIGCDDAANSLSRMIERKCVPHTILFSGPSGCGKTTLARILKDEMKCGDLDFVEMNSASFRGIDTIRDIQSRMWNAPQSGEVRVWIIDECHQLSKDAMNAALKMLEDTPCHVYFFLCTTEANKLIEAIRTRCTPMNVRSLTYKELETLCDRVCKKEGITISSATRDSLVASALGSARSLLVMLEKINNLDEDQQQAAIEKSQREQNESIDLCRALMSRKSWKIISSILKNLTSDPELVRWSVLGYARACLLANGDWESYNVIKCFENHFFDSKEAGLAAACYEAIHTEK